MEQSLYFFFLNTKNKLLIPIVCHLSLLWSEQKPEIQFPTPFQVWGSMDLNYSQDFLNLGAQR